MDREEIGTEKKTKTKTWHIKKENKGILFKNLIKKMPSRRNYGIFLKWWRENKNTWVSQNCKKFLLKTESE